ncbi:MAG TPA: hypothetical protein VMU51_34180 [Mycobacteriales bacterium]|nr:hypothetical protein [Mycobacteriales bacterium]
MVGDPPVCVRCTNRHEPAEQGNGAGCCLRVLARGGAGDVVCGRRVSAGWCEGCTRAAARAVAGLPELYAQVWLGLGPAAAGPSAGRRGGGAVEPGMPIGSGAGVQLLVDLVDVVCGWEDELRRSAGFAARPARRAPAASVSAWDRPIAAVRAERAWLQDIAQACRGQLAAEDLTEQDRGRLQARLDELLDRVRDCGRRERVLKLRRSERLAELDGQRGPTLVAACRFLGAHLPALLALDPAAGDELLDLARRAGRLAGTGRLVHHLPAPCPACGLRTLVRVDGAGHVECEGCAARWDESAYRRLTVVLAAEAAADGRTEGGG